MTVFRLLICWLFFLFCGCVPAHAVLTLTEVYANPPGDEAVGEWIELYNPATASESTAGYLLKDTAGSVKQFPLPTATISGQSYFLIWRTLSGISLNNDGEEVILVSPGGASESSGMFVTAEGKSWTKSGGKWLEAIPSPGYATESVGLSASFSSTTGDQVMISTVVVSSSSGAMAEADLAATQSALGSSEVKNLLSVRLSEVASCASPQEWAELEVTGVGFPSALTGWSLQDGSGNRHDLSGISVIDSGLIVVEWKSGWLANTGETLSLHQNGLVVEEVVLPACSYGQSYQRYSDGWRMVSAPSPGAKNESMSSSEHMVRLAASPSFTSELKKETHSNVNFLPHQGDSFIKHVPWSGLTFSLPEDLRATDGGRVLPQTLLSSQQSRKVLRVPVVSSRVRDADSFGVVGLGFVLVGQLPIWWRFRERIQQTVGERLGLVLSTHRG